MKLRTDLFLIQDVLEALNDAHEEYRVLPPEEAQEAVDWLKRGFPIARWGRVLWGEVPGSTCRTWTTWEENVGQLRATPDELQLGNPSVIVTWSNALAASIETSLAAVARHAGAVLDADFDTWIMCPQAGWCIENYHEGELCFGRTGAVGTSERL